MHFPSSTLATASCRRFLFSAAFFSIGEDSNPSWVSVGPPNVPQERVLEGAARQVHGNRQWSPWSGSGRNPLLGSAWARIPIRLRCGGTHEKKTGPQKRRVSFLYSPRAPGVRRRSRLQFPGQQLPLGAGRWLWRCPGDRRQPWTGTGSGRAWGRVGGGCEQTPAQGPGRAGALSVAPPHRPAPPADLSKQNVVFVKGSLHPAASATGGPTSRASSPAFGCPPLFLVEV